MSKIGLANIALSRWGLTFVWGTAVSSKQGRSTAGVSNHSRYNELDLNSGPKLFHSPIGSAKSMLYAPFLQFITNVFKFHASLRLVFPCNHVGCSLCMWFHRAVPLQRSIHISPKLYLHETNVRDWNVYMHASCDRFEAVPFFNGIVLHVNYILLRICRVPILEELDEYSFFITGTCSFWGLHTTSQKMPSATIRKIRSTIQNEIDQTTFKMSIYLFEAPCWSCVEGFREQAYVDL